MDDVLQWLEAVDDASGRDSMNVAIGNDVVHSAGGDGQQPPEPCDSACEEGAPIFSIGQPSCAVCPQDSQQTSSDAASIDTAAGVESVADIESLYRDDIVQTLEPIRKLRGQVQSEHLCFSVCSGAAPDGRLGALSGIPLRSIFTNDNKASCYRWVEANGPHGHHFIDLREIAANLKTTDKEWSFEATCTSHEMEHCTVSMPKGVVDSIITGTSCKPFSLARTGRMLGTHQHDDSDLMLAFCKLVQGVQPAFAILENVAGFMLPESKSVSQSPMQKLLEIMAQMNPNYSPVVFMMTGSLFQVFTRNRVYLVFFRDSAGGSDAAKMCTRLVQEP